MKKMKLNVLALKIFIILAAIPMLFLEIYLFPPVIKLAFTSDFILAPHVLILIFSVYIMSLPYFVTLYKSFKLLLLIDKGNFFSLEALAHLRLIKISIYSAALILMADMPFLYILVEYDDSPGLLLMGLIVFAVTLFVAVFTSVLRDLVKSRIVE